MISRFFKFEIPKINSVCTYCGKKWEEGAICYSSIYEESEGHWKRCDACESCQPQLSENAEDRFFWQSRIVPKTKKEAPPMEPIHKALEMLRCGLTDNALSAGEAFVLALFLKRKKKLIEKKEIHSSTGETCILYEDPCSEEAFAIPKINYESIEVQKIQDELKLKFSN